MRTLLAAAALAATFTAGCSAPSTPDREPAETTTVLAYTATPTPTPTPKPSKTSARTPVHTPTPAKPKAPRKVVKPRPKPKPTRTRKVAQPAVRSGVHPGAFCAPQGALGRTSAGTLMRCSSKGGDQARWRRA